MAGPARVQRRTSPSDPSFHAASSPAPPPRRQGRSPGSGFVWKDRRQSGRRPRRRNLRKAAARWTSRSTLAISRRRICARPGPTTRNGWVGTSPTAAMAPRAQPSSTSRCPRASAWAAAPTPPRRPSCSSREAANSSTAVSAMHDLRSTGSDDLRVIAFFSAPEVEQHWTDEVWPGDLRVTRTPTCGARHASRVRASYFLKRRASAASPLGNARAMLTATTLSDGVPLAERNVVPGDVAGLLRQVAVAHGIDGVVIRVWSVVVRRVGVGDPGASHQTQRAKRDSKYSSHGTIQSVGFR